jgi:hypothetical protein
MVIVVAVAVVAVAYAVALGVVDKEACSDHNNSFEVVRSLAYSGTEGSTVDDTGEHIAEDTVDMEASFVEGVA